MINELPLENYLCKVVPSEMPASYQKEALKAQAICARSYAYRQIMDYAYPEYQAHVNDSTDYQVYNNSASQQAATEAVQETAGKVLKYNGNIITAYYYSTSCGKTTTMAAWGTKEKAENAYLQSVEVKDPTGDYERNLPWYRGEADIDQNTLSKMIAENTKKNIGTVQSLEVTKSGPGGAALQIKEGCPERRFLTGRRVGCRMQEKKPVILMVPVNLRKIFPSDSMLNFFGYIEPGYQFGEEKDSFEDVLETVKIYFRENLSKEHVAGQMNELIAIEKHKILKWAPLELKNRCIRAGAKMAEQEVTAVLSNMSVVKMPEDYADYIEKFGVYTSTNRTELCICSFKDTLSLSFTSRYDSTNIQRNFYRILKELGVQVTVTEADFPKDAKANYEGKKVLQIFTFCCIAAIVISMMTDIIISPGVHWSVYVASGCATMWFTMAVGYVKRFNLLKNAAWQLLIMSGICVLWDLGTGWRGWSVNIGIPNICLLIQIVMLIISRIRSLSPREYMIYYVMASVYSMILPFVLLMTGVIRYRTPSVICIGCSFLLMIGLIMFKRKEFKEEMHKKFHVG